MKSKKIDNTKKTIKKTAKKPVKKTVKNEKINSDTPKVYSQKQRGTLIQVAYKPYFTVSERDCTQHKHGLVAILDIVEKEMGVRPSIEALKGVVHSEGWCRKWKMMIDNTLNKIGINEYLEELGTSIVEINKKENEIYGLVVDKMLTQLKSNDNKLNQDLVRLVCLIRPKSIDKIIDLYDRKDTSANRIALKNVKSIIFDIEDEVKDDITITDSEENE